MNNVLGYKEQFLGFISNKKGKFMIYVRYNLLRKKGNRRQVVQL